MPSPAGNAGARAPLMARLVARPIAPFALALLAAFAACAAFGYVLARESDARHQAQRRIALLGVVDEYRIVFAEMTRRAAAGLSTVPLTAGPDLAGALEPAGLARYRHEHACLVATDGAVIASMPAGSPVPPAVAGVIARFRARSAADDPVDHPASVATPSSRSRPCTRRNRRRAVAPATTSWCARNASMPASSMCSRGCRASRRCPSTLTRGRGPTARCSRCSTRRAAWWAG